jgi:hypothetical protein
MARKQKPTPSLRLSDEAVIARLTKLLNGPGPDEFKDFGAGLDAQGVLEPPERNGKPPAS